MNRCALSLLALLAFSYPAAAPAADAAPVAANGPAIAAAREQLRKAEGYAAAHDLDQAREAFLATLTQIVSIPGAGRVDAETGRLFDDLNHSIDAFYQGARQPEHVESLKQFVAAVRHLNDQNPNNFLLSFALCAYLRIQGRVLEPFDWTSALYTFEESLTRDRKLAAAVKGEADDLLTLGLALELGEIGAIKLKVHDPGGLDALREAAGILNSAARRRLDDERARGMAWTAYVRFAGATATSGNRQDALDAYQAAADLWEPPFPPSAPTAESVERRLLALQMLASAKAAMRDMPGARVSLEKAANVAQESGKAFPNTEGLDEVSFNIALNLVNANLALNEFATATDLATRLVASTKDRFAADGTPANRRRAAQALEALAWMDFARKRKEAALPEARECATFVRTAAASAPAQFDARMELFLAQCLAVQVALDPDWRPAMTEALPHLANLAKQPGASGAVRTLKQILDGRMVQQGGGGAPGGYAGGDGSTMEKAILSVGAKTDSEGTLSIMAYMRSRLPDCRMETQALVAQGLRKYDVITCRDPMEQKRTLYFDITESFGKM